MASLLSSVINTGISKANDVIDSVIDTLNLAREKQAGKNSIDDDLCVIDNDWINHRFMVGDNKLDEIDQRVRRYTSASLKFTDTSLGGNIGINPRPQFTRYADIRATQRVSRDPVTTNITTGDHGMGRYYSEAIDDNAQLAYFQFGVPEFNSLFNYFTRAIDYRDMYVANKGKYPYIYEIVSVVTAYSMLVTYPAITSAIWLGKAVLSFLTYGDFNYYYLNPTPHTYWACVSNIATQFSVDLGILAPELMPTDADKKTLGLPITMTQDHMDELKKLLPGLIGESNYIDVFAIATKSQTIVNRQTALDFKYMSEGIAADKSPFEYEMMRSDVMETGLPKPSLANNINNYLSFAEYLKEVTDNGSQFGLYDKEEEDKQDVEKREATEDMKEAPPTKMYAKTDEGYEPVDPMKGGWKDKFYAAVDSSLRKGGAYVIFYVDPITSVSDSFSNSTSEIDTGGTARSIAKSIRNFKFNAAGGNIIPGMGNVIDAAEQVINGFAETATFGLSSILNTILGNAFVDMPLKWDDSDARLNDVSLTIQLRSPYGDPFSQLQNIYIPLAMILAGALPQSTGNSSYTSPFLCSFYSKGIANIELGIISDISITRGVTTLPYSRTRRPLGIDVTLTVKDLSTRMATPTNATLWSGFKAQLREESPFGKYLGSLVGRSLYNYAYVGRKLMLRYSRARMTADAMFSPAMWGMATGESLEFFLGGFIADNSAIKNS